jgi:predicted transcriptional regulator
MDTITVSLPDDRLRALQKLSSQLNVSPEELIRLSIEELLTRPQEAFLDAAEYILDKNSDLYRRLAA